MAAQAFPLGSSPNPLSSTGEQMPSPGQQMNPMQELAAAIPPNIMQRFMAENQGLPPDQLQAKFIEMATDYAQKSDIGSDQMRQGGRMLSNAIRNQPQGRTTSGGLYTAANPLEHIANLGIAYVGNERYNEGLGARRDAQASEAKLKADAIRRISSGQQ